MARLSDIMIKGSFFRILAPLLNAAVTIVMMPFIIRCIGDRWYGLWVLAASFVGYYGFLDLGLSTANERFISRELGRENYEEVNRIFNTCLSLFFVAGFIVLVASIAVVIATPHFVKNPTDIHVFRIMIVLIGLTMVIFFPAQAFVGVIRAYVRFDVLNILDIAKLVVRTVLIYVFLKRGYGIVTLAVVSVSMEILTMLATVVYAVRTYPHIVVRLSYFAREKIRHLFGYSVYGFLSNLANQLQFQIDAFVITGFLGLAFVTHYNIGARIARYYIMVVGSAITLAMPVFSRFEGQSDYDRIREKFILVAKLNTILSMYVGGSLLIFGKAFIMRWMGEAYVDSYYVLVILMIGLIFNTIQVASRTLLYGLSMHKPYSFIVTAEGLANVALSIILVRKYGMYGVAMGTTIPTLVTNLFIIPVYATRAADIPLGRYIRVVGGGIVLGAAIHAAIWFLVRGFILDSYSRILALGALATLLFLAANAFLMLTKRERAYFRIPV